MLTPIYFYKTDSLTNLKANSLVALKTTGDTAFSLFITDKNGLPYPLKDEGGTGGITAIQNTDGNLTITGGSNKVINVSTTLLNLINSALQSGDNVSNLINDANYITLADIPTFVASDYDLEDFTNTSADPFIRQSDVISGGANLEYTPSPTQGTVTSDTGTDAIIPLADVTNAGLLKPAKYILLEAIEEAFTTILKATYDSAVSTLATLLTTGSRLITSGEITKLSNTSGTNSGDNATNTQYSGLATSKQDTLVSGTNIKTINSNSLLGSGDITIVGGGAKVYNVKDYGALGNGSTDDTTAIQNTINAVFTAGGGVVYFPIGVYIIGGALQTSISGINYNSQLYIPQVNSDNSARTTISFLGEVQPNLVQTLGINTWIAPNSGVILRSTIQGSGTLPSVICNKGAAGNNVAGFSYTNVNFKNLSIQITPNVSSKLTIGGINCEFSAIANFEYITVFPYNLNLLDSGEPNIIEIVGISMPSVNSEHINTIRNCTVGGFTHGYTLAEHSSVYDAISICCVNAFTQKFNHHLGLYAKLSSFWNRYDFNVVADSKFVIQSLQTEYDIKSKWFDTLATVNDPSNLGNGIVNYNIVAAGVGLDNTKYIKAGGAKIKSKAISVSPINRDITTTTYTFGATDADKSLITTTNASAVTLTLNNDSYYNFDIGCVLNVSQYGSGQITIVAGSGNSIVSAETMKTRKQHSTISLVKISWNAWLLTGDLELL